MEIINLDNLDGISEKLMKKLRRNKSIFLGTEFLEDIEDYEQIQELFSEINDYCKSNFIIGYHYTNANPDEILTNGLLCRTGEEIRNNFLDKYGHLFTAHEIKLMKSEWEEYYNDFHKDARDKKIYFNFTLSAFPGFGTESLLGNFGGEQIYMAIDHIESIKIKLEKIGVPLIVKALLNPKEINATYDRVWGRIAVSTFQRMQNPEAGVVDVDGFQQQPIHFSRIHSIVRV